MPLFKNQTSDLLKKYAKELPQLIISASQEDHEKIYFINNLFYEAAKEFTKEFISSKEIDDMVYSQLNTIFDCLCECTVVNGACLSKLSLNIQECIAKNIDIYAELSLKLHSRNEQSIDINQKAEKLS